MMSTYLTGMKDSFKIREITRADFAEVKKENMHWTIDIVVVEAPQKGRWCDLAFCVSYCWPRDVIESLLATHLILHRSEYTNRDVGISRIERWDEIGWDNHTVFLSDIIQAGRNQRRLGIERRSNFGLTERTFTIGDLVDRFSDTGVYSKAISELKRQGFEVEGQSAAESAR